MRIQSAFGRGVVATAAVVLLAGSVLAQQQRPPRRGLPPRNQPPAQSPGQDPGQDPNQPADPNQPQQPGQTPGQQNPSPGTPSTTPPAAPAANPPAPREAPKRGAYIERTNPRDMTLSIRLELHSDESHQTDARGMPRITPFAYDTFGLVFPFIEETAASETVKAEFTGTLHINDQPVDSEPVILTGYPSGTNLARWDMTTGGQARQVHLEATIPMRCWRTKFDEAAAKNVPWPTGPWPGEAQSTFTPELYVEMGIDGNGSVVPYENKVVGQALETWYKEEGITDPRKVPPVMIAKLIAGKVWRDVQPSGDGMTFTRTGQLSGIALQPPDLTLSSGRGSYHDVTVMMVALMRRAGLPARAVIGYDAGSGDAKFLDKRRSAKELRSWVEFCLYDEAKNTINWVPVDVVKLRRMSSRPMPFTRDWKYFGNHDELDRVTPFAFQFHPPTDVVSYGSPGFWGWFVTPAPPSRATQALDFAATLTPVRGGDQDRDRRR